MVIHHMLTSGEPYRYAPERTTSEKLGRMHYHATGVRRKGGTPKGSKLSPLYGTGVSGRTVRARQDRERLQEAQRQYQKFLKEKGENYRGLSRRQLTQTSVDVGDQGLAGGRGGFHLV